MPVDTKEALAQIDAVFQRKKEITDAKQYFPPQIAELSTLYSAAIKRLSPPGSPYIDMMERAFTAKDRPYVSHDEQVLERLEGALNALRADYLAGRLQTFQELVHADLFSDFLEMAEYFLAEGYKDPAAVIAGGVLEQHLRKLCQKSGLSLVGHPKLDTMNSDLARANAYGKNDQKQVTAWAGIRNDAAHGNYGAYTEEQAKLMISGIREFLSRCPA